MKFLGRLTGFYAIHLKKRFFLFIDTFQKSLTIAELTVKDELDGKKLPVLIPAGFFSERSIYVRWEMKITPIHLILFFSTLLTTTVAGAMMQGINPLSKDVWKGFYFSIPLLFILSCHEFGHIFAMWKYGVRSSFPFFIPAPNIVGTFGAIMVLRERVSRASHIVKIGAAGPIAGFLAAIPIAILGLKLSYIAEIPKSGGDFFIKLGSPLIFSFIEKIFFGNLDSSKDVMLHPVAFAGWIGFFVTAMNLIPIGQTDGGHIVFGIFPSLHRKISLLFVITLFLLGIFFWYGWIFWGVLTALLGLRKIPYSPQKDAGKGEKAIALLAFIIFILTFIVTPIDIQF